MEHNMLNEETIKKLEAYYNTLQATIDALDERADHALERGREKAAKRAEDEMNALVNEKKGLSRAVAHIGFVFISGKLVYDPTNGYAANYPD